MTGPWEQRHLLAGPLADSGHTEGGRIGALRRGGEQSPGRVSGWRLRTQTWGLVPGWHPDSQASAEQGGSPAECRIGDTELRTRQGKTRGEPAGSPSHALEEGAEEVDCLLASTHLVLPARFP